MDVLIIGAGAAGLFCARTAGARGRRVAVLDHAAQPGRKLLISGGGKCNFTNRDVRADHYSSANPRFCMSALAQFSAADCIAWIESHRIAYEERAAGQLFTCHGAAQIVNALLQECAQAGVRLMLDAAIESVTRDAHAFVAKTARGVFCAPQLVVATGGLAYPQCGATGLGYDLARQFGLPVIAPRPALVPLQWQERERALFGVLSGIALRAELRGGRHAVCDDVLFTHTGLSGPAALQMSTYWQPGQTLALNLLPGVDVEQALRARQDGREPLRRWLGRHLPRRVAHAVCELHAVPDKPLAQLSRADVARARQALQCAAFTPAGTRGYAAAEVTAGGVDTAALSSKSLQARGVPGLFFVGEVVDVTGQLGGYNLQWAWSSGHAAGQHV